MRSFKENIIITVFRFIEDNNYYLDPIRFYQYFGRKINYRPLLDCEECEIFFRRTMQDRPVRMWSQNLLGKNIFK